MSNGCQCCHCHDHDHHDREHEHDHEEFSLRKLLVGCGLFGAGLLLQGCGVNVLPVLAYVAAYILLGGEVVLSAGKNMLHGRVFDENFLMSIATLGAFVIGEYPEAVAVMLFYRLGEGFEHKAVEKSRSQIMAAVDMRPETVRLWADGQEIVIAAAEAKVGDQILVRPGDRIGLDGVVVSGESRLDTAPITGEPVPVFVSAGDRVLSGCVNLSGALILQVENALEESLVTRILDSVEQAAASKPKMDRFITRFSRYYTPVVVFLALATAVIPSLFDGNWQHWCYTALCFLVMSCPCALVLSVPLTFFSGIGAGSKEGILFKGGAVMEALVGIKAVALDKTGTVTRGSFRVQKVETEAEDLRLCASLEQRSNHPVAQSISEYARNMNLTEPEHLEEIPGAGIYGKVDGKKVLCGNEKLMTQFGVDITGLTMEQKNAQVLIAVDGAFSGAIWVCDEVKPDAEDAVNRLKHMGYRTAMLTGDKQATAKKVAQQVHIDQVFSQLLPQEKLEKLNQLRQSYGPVLFVGDGINDAPTLSGADVGAAMGSGADVALEAADVVFLSAQTTAIPRALEIAAKTKRCAVQNIAFALAIKCSVMLLGLLGWSSMWAAVFADTGVALLCVLNAVSVLFAGKKS